MKVSLFQLNKLGNKLNTILDKFYDEDIYLMPTVQIGPDDDNDFIWDACVEFKNGSLYISGSNAPSGSGEYITIKVTFNKNSISTKVIQGENAVDLGYLAFKEVYVEYNDEQIPFIKELLNL